MKDITKRIDLLCVYKPGTGKFLLTLEAKVQKLKMEQWLTPEQLRQIVSNAKAAYDHADEKTIFSLERMGGRQLWTDITVYLRKVYDGFASTHITDGAHKHNTKLPIKNGNS